MYLGVNIRLRAEDSVVILTVELLLGEASSLVIVKVRMKYSTQTTK